MASELALIDILRNDATIQGFCGTRIYPIRAPQGDPFPRIVVRQEPGTQPNDTKDGPSELDFERVQILIESETMDADFYSLGDRVRAILDRPASGTYNGVDLESSAFDDDDKFDENLVDKTVYVWEQIYRTMVLR